MLEVLFGNITSSELFPLFLKTVISRSASAKNKITTLRFDKHFQNTFLFTLNHCYFYGIRNAFITVIRIIFY